jgi:predicted nucleic acid-binding protein
MKRVLFDTNIYGRIIEMEEAKLIEEMISKKIIADGEKLRPFVLGLYNRLVKDSYPITNAMKDLAKAASKNKLWNDFLIVACASIHNLDIVVSEDNQTMLSEYAIKAYKVTNKLRNYRIPNFINYNEFRRLFV